MSPADNPRRPRGQSSLPDGWPAKPDDDPSRKESTPAPTWPRPDVGGVPWHPMPGPEPADRPYHPGGETPFGPTGPTPSDEVIR
jgi:hypothetical protein